MRRDVLRYPVSQQLRKILNDFNEWAVITDLKLNPLVMKRAERGCIQNHTWTELYSELNKKYPNKKLRVYQLHTHLRCDYVPSAGDIKHDIEAKLNHNEKFVVVGYGTITDKGILIMRLPEKREKLNRLLSEEVDQKYDHNARKNIRKHLGMTTNESIAIKLLQRPDHIKIIDKTYGKAFRELKLEEPDLKSKVIRRTHRFNMRRRR